MRTGVDGSVRLRSNGFAGAPAPAAGGGTANDGAEAANGGPVTANRGAAIGAGAFRAAGVGADTFTRCSPRIASSISSVPHPFSIASLANASDSPPPPRTAGTGAKEAGATLAAAAGYPGMGANVKGAAVACVAGG
jgi:hypothetical protein